MSDLILSYYGDDFTGSTDVMEALSFAGLKTVLFLSPPKLEQIAKFKDVKAVGVAGCTRSMSPDDMERELTPVYEAFRKLKTPIVHYKTCSTFDSAPDVGSIGRAIDLGQDVFGGAFVPLVVGAPVLNRYCVFGNLFARSGLDSDLFRLDRHPTMKQHPITPMTEADLRLHLGKQTHKSIGLLDVLALGLDDNELAHAFDAVMKDKPDVLLFDTVYNAHLPKIGRLIWQQAQKNPLFVAGSSGAEYALVAHWRDVGILPETFVKPTVNAVDQIVIVSGSCSPVTANQIDHAVQHGFAEVALDPVLFADPSAVDGAVEAGIQAGLKAMADGQSAILHTGRGPGDPRIAQTTDHLKRQGYTDLDIKLKSGEVIGTAVGRILKGILTQSKLKRAATAGGDTSYYVAKALGIEALEVVAPTAPGSPMCRIFGAGLDGIEMTFKGGQVGKVDFFMGIKTGKFS
jgi:uncharacterized protein YgbK (DUF1537 family)